MQNALIELLEENEFADISIMAICQRAGVNRSTFYAHYDNTYDLLKETQKALVTGFHEECTFEDPVDITDMENLDIGDLNFVTPKYLLPYLNYIRKHKRLFKIYAENAHTFEVNDMNDYMIEKLFVPIYAKHGVTDKRLVYYMQKFFLKGIDAIINEWVHNDCRDDISYICKIIIHCIRPDSVKLTDGVL